MTDSNSIHDALLIVGHGTRDTQGQRQFMKVVHDVAQAVSTASVLPAFLELAEPTIDEAIDLARQRGARRLTVMPLLLFAAGHAKRDIPDAVRLAARRHNGLSTQILPHLGCHCDIIELSAVRYRETTAQSADFSDRDTALVMVGRGSRDAEATAEMHEFTRRRVKITPVQRVETCFAAMATPRLEDTLAQVMELPVRLVVVQPHLLFSGDLLSRIQSTAHEIGRCNPRQHWAVSGPLGPHWLLVSAIKGISGFA